jgi:16S rRNA (cytosine1402-N4)-methyltransferase
VPHEPVLADEVVILLAPRPGEVVVDCTFGAGGHARRLAPALGPDGLYVAIDRDPTAEALFEDFAQDVVCATRFVRGNFSDVLPALLNEGLRASAVLMDLGLSSMQIDDPERGFSYASQAPLDMRMDPDLERSAADLVAEASEAELTGWFREYGEERYARAIARAIVARRAEAEIESTAELVEIVRGAVPQPALFAGGHPAKRVFQALRIAVNLELESLDAALEPAFELLEDGGRLAVISFHSLEDRRVKRFMRDRVRRELYPPDLPVRGETHVSEAEALTPRPLRPKPAETDRNPRSRSARLRAVRRRSAGAGRA